MKTNKMTVDSTKKVIDLINAELKTLHAQEKMLKAESETEENSDLLSMVLINIFRLIRAKGALYDD